MFYQQSLCQTLGSQSFQSPALEWLRVRGAGYYTPELSIQLSSQNAGGSREGLSYKVTQLPLPVDL